MLAFRPEYEISGKPSPMTIVGRSSYSRYGKALVVFAVYCHYFLNIFDGNLMVLVPMWHLARKSLSGIIVRCKVNLAGIQS